MKLADNTFREVKSKKRNLRNWEIDFWSQYGVRFQKSISRFDERIPLSIRTLKIIKIITLQNVRFKVIFYFREIFSRSKPMYDWNHILDNSIIIES